jgi:hypothetical protein
VATILSRTFRRRRHRRRRQRANENHKKCCRRRLKLLLRGCQSISTFSQLLISRSFIIATFIGAAVNSLESPKAPVKRILLLVRGELVITLKMTNFQKK